MTNIYFSTTNKEKLLIAETVAAKFGIKVEQVVLEIDEIQGEDPETIVKDKALRAYEQFGKPIVVSDDSWSIPALRGFPGPYMKSINHWFKPEDFLRLMSGVKDRSIILNQYLAYHDGQNITVFSNGITGRITNEPRGRNDKSPNMSVIVLDGDSNKTIAEVFSKGQQAVSERYLDRNDVWHGFVDWYMNNI